MQKRIGKLEFAKPANHAVTTHRSLSLTIALRQSEHANSVPLHFHEYDEFIYSPNGVNNITWRNSNFSLDTKLLPTTVLWTPAGIRHSASWDSAWYSVGVLLNKEIFDSSLRILGVSRPTQTVFFQAGEELTMLLQLALCQSWLERISLDDEFARALAIVLSKEIVSCYRHRPLEANGSAQTLSFEKLLEFIDANLAVDLCLKDLAQIANLSPHHFSRLFKMSTGSSPYQYVVSRRLRHALPQLSARELSIDEIARTSGFSSASSFAKAFKRVYRVSPSLYRKNLALE